MNLHTSLRLPCPAFLLYGSNLKPPLSGSQFKLGSQVDAGWVGAGQALALPMVENYTVWLYKHTWVKIVCTVVTWNLVLSYSFMSNVNSVKMQMVVNMFIVFKFICEFYISSDPFLSVFEMS